jgi:hypothetical protein
MPDRDSPWRTLLRAELPEIPQTDMDVRDVGEVCVTCAMASSGIDWLICRYTLIESPILSTLSRKEYIGCCLQTFSQRDPRHGYPADGRVSVTASAVRIDLSGMVAQPVVPDPAGCIHRFTQLPPHVNSRAHLPIEECS